VFSRGKASRFGTKRSSAASLTRLSPSPESSVTSTRRSSDTGSGQYTRLAFAVAAYLEPEILLVDEVWQSVMSSSSNGCIGRMKSVAKLGRDSAVRQSNMDAKSPHSARGRFCCGRPSRGDGPAREVVLKYLAASTPQHVARCKGEAVTIQVRLLATSVSTPERNGVLCTDCPILIEFIAEVRAPVLDLSARSNCIQG